MDKLRSYFGSVCSNGGAEAREKFWKTKTRLNDWSDNISTGDDGQPIIGDNSDDVEEFHDVPTKK